MHRLLWLILAAFPAFAAKPVLSVPEPPTWLLPLTAVVLFLFRPRKRH